MGNENQIVWVDTIYDIPKLWFIIQILGDGG